MLRTPIRSVQASEEAWGHHEPFREESIGPWECPNHYCSHILGVSGGSTRRHENPPLTGLKACLVLLRRCPPFNDQVPHPKTQLASTRLSPDHTVEYSPFLTSWERLRRVSQANLGRRLDDDIELQPPPAVEHPGATQTRQYVDA